jgi:hypothetical protein
MQKVAGFSTVYDQGHHPNPGKRRGRPGRGLKLTTIYLVEMFVYMADITRFRNGTNI